jgi:hypothetical protein
MRWFEVISADHWTKIEPKIHPAQRSVVSHFECNSRKTPAVSTRATPETALKRSK